MTRWAIENDRVTFAFVLIIAIGGIVAFVSLPQDEDPGFTIRTALVLTYFPGASPERVEDLVTDTLEEAIQEMPELDFLSSESRTGVSLIFVNVQQRYKNMRPIWDDLRRKVERAAPELPDGTRGPIVNDEFGDVFGILLTLTGEGYSDAELKHIGDEVRDELLMIDQAAKVEIFGQQDERVFVEYNNARLAELGLSASQLQQILTARNIVIPGGDIRVGTERVALEPSGNYETIEDLAKTIIRLPGRPEVVYLGDVADVRRGYVDPASSIVRSSGAPALALGISLRDKGNILELGEGVRETVARLQARYPIGLELETIAFQPDRVEQKVDEFVGNLLQAVGIVLLVMLVSLRLRTGLVVASLIPTAILMSLMIMGFAGIGLNQMSLAALIIALGMLIDNAIVMSESILVQMGEGKSALRAAVDSGSELGLSLLTSSLTTAAAFLPFYLAKSTSGEYTGVIFVVVGITLLCSWLLSLTMIPLLCVRFLRVTPSAKPAGYETPFYRAYRSALTWMLRHRLVTVVGTIVVFAAVMSTFGMVPKLFFPKADRSFFTAQLTLPTGTAIETTDEMVREIERYVTESLVAGKDRDQGVSTWASFVGGGEPRYILNADVEQANAAYAFMLLNTTSPGVVSTLIDKLAGFCSERFPDVIATIQPSEMGPPVTKPIQIRLSGRDTDRVFIIVDQIKAQLRSIAGTRNITDNWGRRTKKLLVEINQARARRAGLTSQDVAVSLQSSLSGVETTQFREGSDIIPVTLRSVAADRQDIGKLESLNVFSQTSGSPVPLGQVADVRVAWEESKILRRDRVKTVTVEANLQAGVTASEVNAALVPWLAENSRSWPLGYRYELGGEIESSIEAQQSIGAQLPTAGLIIVLLLVGQFNSFRRPLIILMTIPLGIVGVVLGLHAFRSYFGFMTLLGVVSLAGIVINNAIVLLDRIRLEIDVNGLEPPLAVVVAAQRRMRPILLTTMTTIGGLIPLYLGGGAMWEPMAVAIMSGLVFATTLTLGLVPVLYSVFFRVDYTGFKYRTE